MTDILIKLFELHNQGAEIPNHLTIREQAELLAEGTKPKRNKYNASSGYLDGVWFRSKTERNQARLLLFNGYVWWRQWYPEDPPCDGQKHFRFEGRSFEFPKIKSKNHAYKCDFELWDSSGYHLLEIKGMMTDDSKTKLKRMAQFYPEIKLTVKTVKEFRAETKGYERMVPGWE